MGHLKHSEALRLVAKRFRSGKNLYTLGICFELALLEANHRISAKKCKELCAYIKSLLGDGAIYLEDWIIRNVRGHDLLRSYPHGNAKMNETRAQWCEWMAQQWEEQGK